MIVRVIIPAFNEENAVGQVIRDIPRELVEEVIVVDNNSSDDTKKKADTAGATVLSESYQGYGASCLRGISYVESLADKTDVIVFLDADYSDYPEELGLLLKPVEEGKAEMVIGSRALGRREKGSMTFPQIAGNKLATYLLRKMYGAKFTDLGPFRAVTFAALKKMDMQDRTYGWTVEMQLKAAKLNIASCEVPVNYRNRVGKSKISGTVKGTVMAGYKILSTLNKYR